MPDYSNYAVYAQFYGRGHDRILGWLDTARAAVQRQDASVSIVIAARDGSSYSVLPTGDVSEAALSPDRQTFFSLSGVDGRSFSLFDINGNTISTLLSGEAKASHYPVWSPNGNYISFAAAGQSLLNGTLYPDYTKSGVWLLDLSKPSQQLVSGDDVWNSTPAWSLDSAKFAFLRADGTVSPGNVWFNHPEGADTNVFIADVSSLAVQQLTKFTGVKSTGLQWTPGGNILVSSTVAGTSGTRGIVAVSSTTGNAVSLVSSAPSQQLEHPTLFISGGLPGMPKTGQATPIP
jgi:Tol biopolymer transport system component